MVKLPIDYVLYAVVVAAGVCVALQQALNANLRTLLGSPWWAGFASFLVGTLVMLGAAIATRAPRLTDLSAAMQASWLTWLGGAFGAIFISVSILTMPRLGSGTVLTLIVMGQMIGAVVMGHFGLLGLPQQPIGAAQICGVTLLVGGVVLVQWT
jgi:transporter family-2 protein